MEKENILTDLTAVAVISCFRPSAENLFNVFTHDVKDPRNAANALLKWRDPRRSITALGVVCQMEGSDDAEGSQD